METVINSIVTKIDAVLVKLEKSDLSKNRRKAAVSKILGTINENDAGDFCPSILNRIFYCFLYIYIYHYATSFLDI